METMYFRKLFPVILWIILVNGVCTSSCKKVSIEKPEQVSIKKYLSFQTASANHLHITQEAISEYKILTTGTDPYILLNPLSNPLSPGNVVFTFEYQSSGEINELQFFFAPPITETRSFKAGELPETTQWKTFSVDLGDYIEEFGWGGKDNFLRLDFGNKPEVTIRFRKMIFRERNPIEQALADARKEAKENDQLLDEKLKKYLSAEFDASISRVSVSESKVTISGRTAGAGDFRLCEITPYEDLVLIKKFGDGVPLNEKNFTVELERFVNKDGFNYDRILSKWVIVKNNESSDAVASYARHADEIRSARSMPLARLSGKKGLGGFAVSRGFLEDLDELQITSVTVNVAFTSFMYLQQRANTLEHSYGGKTYYFDKTRIEDLDRTLQKASEKDIVVAAIILTQKASECADPAIGELLQHPSYTEEGIFTMPNMTTSSAVNCYAAALDFLASRYNRPDNAYGRIHKWIMHNEVDAGIIWSNMGEKPMAVFMDNYIKSMRLCYNIARNYDAAGQVLGSFTHSWNEPVEPRFYATTEMLDFLKQSCNAEGDFQWGLAYHSYPEDLNEPKTWNDARANFKMNTPLVTFKNLEVLDTWIKKPENKFMGSIKRTLWLSENGTNSRTYSEKDLEEQAAGLAFAWKKIEVLDGIDAIQWHNWIDNRGEFGLRIGLRRFPDDETEPAGRKPVWYVYKAAGTEEEDTVFEPYKQIIGIDDWSEILNNDVVP
jgi:hypothetical protein